MTATRTRNPRIVAALVAGLAVAAVALVVVVQSGGGGAPTELAAPLPARGPAPRWDAAKSLPLGISLALRADSRGRPLLLTDDGGWKLLREDDDGRLIRIASQPHATERTFTGRGDFGIDRRGRPIIVWTNDNGTGGLMADIGGHTSRIASGRIDLTNPIVPDGSARSSLAVSPDGSAVVGWGSLNADDDDTLWIADRKPGAATFGARRSLGDSLGDPVVLADRRGDALVVWSPEGDATDDGIRAIVRPPGGHFGAPIVFGRGEYIDAFGAGLGPNGRAIVVWNADDGVEAAQRPAGRPRFERPVELLHGRFSEHGIDVAIGDRGAASIVWDHSFTIHRGDEYLGQDAIATVSWPAGERPGKPRQVTDSAPSRLGGAPRVLAATPDGPLVVFAPGDHPHAWRAVTPTGRIARLTDSGPPIDALEALFSAGPHGVVAAYQRGDGDVPDRVARLPLNLR